MKRRLHNILFVLVCTFCTWNLLPAQPTFEHFRRIDESMGLPTNAIWGICKDDEGFMWFATLDGLCRFDGTQFKIYRNIPNDSTSLFDNYVMDVTYYKGKIWAATEMGLSILDLSTEKFSHVQFDSFAINRSPKRTIGKQATKFYIDPRDQLWIGTQGHGPCRYLTEQDSFQFFPPEKLRNNPSFYKLNNDYRTNGFTASRTNDSIIYVGTPTGLQEINYFTGKYTWYYFPHADPKIEASVNVFRRIYFHDDGLLYSGRWSDGVYVFDPIRKTNRSLPKQKDKDAEYILRAGARSFFRKSADEIWITTGFGIVLYNSKLQQVTFSKKNDLEHQLYYGIDYIDERQRVWLLYNGVNLFDPIQQQVVSYSYDGLRPPGDSYTFYILPGPTDREILLFPGNDVAIYHYDLQSRRFTRHILSYPGSKKEGIGGARGFAKAPDGSYTLVGDDGTFRYDPRTHKLRRLPVTIPAGYFNLRDLHWDKSGKLWTVNIGAGAFRWDPKTNRVRHFDKEFTTPEVNVEKPMIERFMEDKRGRIWFSRTGGFAVYFPSRDTVLNFLHKQSPNNTFPFTNWITEGHDGKIWISGQDGWLGYAESDHPEKGIVQKFNLREKLGLPFIFFMTVDSLGTLWGITDKGLFYMEMKTLEFHSLSFDYAGGKIDFFSLEYLPSMGKIVIGGRSDFYVFDPTTMKRNLESPKPYIQEIQVKGQTLLTIPHVDGKPSLRLRHWQNDFSITFSAIAYTLGEKCRYRYRLRGQEDWQDAGNRRFINYTNVPGGDYVFELQVANNEGIWSPSVFEMPVWVETAWWATWWFRTLIICAILGLIYGVYRYRILQVRREERLRSAYEKRLANVEMSALLAQMNPHFLFNSLNSIDSYIIRNESRKASEYLNNFARLMRLILNNSRTNYISLQDELEALDLYLQMESLRFKDKFEYEIIVSETIDPASISIPPMLIQPYIENAIWHGLMLKDAEAGKVTVRVDLKDETLQCVIEDNGVGRAYAMELRAKRGGNKRQSMGMKITEDRIEIINKLYDANTQVKVIDLYDEAGKPAGTRVVLTIPI